MSPTLSIITINRNNAEGLRKTIESVVTQTCDDYEYIIIDGASTDDSVAVIKEYAEHPEYGKKISYWVSEPDSGTYNAMNKAIKISSGYYCLFLNSGDYFMLNSILTKITTLNCEPVIYYANVQYAEDNVLTNIYTYDDNIDVNFFLLGSTINHQNALIPRLILLEQMCYDESYLIKADWLFFFKISFNKICSFRHLNYTISVYDFTGMSSSSKNKNIITQETIKGIKQVCGELSKSILEYSALKNSIYAKTIELGGNSRFYQFCLKAYLYLLRRFKINDQFQMPIFIINLSTSVERKLNQFILKKPVFGTWDARGYYIDLIAAKQILKYFPTIETFADDWTKLAKKSKLRLCYPKFTEDNLTQPSTLAEDRKNASVQSKLTKTKKKKFLIKCFDHCKFLYKKYTGLLSPFN